jgi:hypothetical protein
MKTARSLLAALCLLAAPAFAQQDQATLIGPDCDKIQQQATEQCQKQGSVDCQRSDMMYKQCLKFKQYDLNCKSQKESILQGCTKDTMDSQACVAAKNEYLTCLKSQSQAELSGNGQGK